VKRRVASSLRVVFVRYRRTKQRHDAVAAVLVNRTLEAVDAFGQDLEETIHGAVPLLRVEFGGELRRAPDVGEQDRHLLALTLESAPGGEDFLGEMFRGVGEGLACGRRRGHLGASGPGRRVSRPCEGVLFSLGDALNVDQLLDDLLRRAVVQRELPPQHPQGQAAVLL
jgi:hypothetical protein